MQRVILLALLVSILYTAKAQQYKDFEFEEKPDFDLTESKRQEDESVLYKKYAVEYIVESRLEEQYTLVHKAIWVNSDDAIERNNKIYLAARGGSEYLFQKARVIKPSGEIKVLQESDIKEGVFEDNERKYYYFALEGLEKGSIIESCTYHKSRPNYYGNLIYLQDDINVYKQTFELIAPLHLYFAFKTVNGTEKVESDTTVNDVNKWMLQLDSVEKILDQPSIYKEVVKKGVLFKLDRNIGTGKGDITSYGLIADQLYQNVHPKLEKSTQKALSKIFKELDVKNLEKEEDKIKAIENYVKNTFQVVQSNQPELGNIDFMLQNKAANETGATIMHLALLKMAGINYELVITTNRAQLRFDPEFEAFLFLDKYLIYFPKQKQYLAPADPFFRYGYVPALYTHNYGLFIKQLSVGGLETSVGKIQFIEPLPYSKSVDNMWVDIDFSKSEKEPQVSIKRESTGYSAQDLQPYFHLLDEEEYDNLKEVLVKSIHEEIKVETEEIKVENVAQNDFGSKPFIYEFSTTDHPFVEKAGDDILFKLGEVIGPQVEMYQEKERQFDVESRHNRGYYREITFNVPQGYEVKNLEDLNIHFRYKNEKEEENLVFVSSYTKEGNKYKVVCEEYYADIVNPKEDFKKYTDVINAAADFNKIVLVLKKAN